MTATVKAKIMSAPGLLPIIQGKKKRMVKNGKVVQLTRGQFIGSFIEAPKLFQFNCPSCRQWYPMIYQLGKKRFCLNCIEWRQPKPVLKKYRQTATSRQQESEMKKIKRKKSKLTLEGARRHLEALEAELLLKQTLLKQILETFQNEHLSEAERELADVQRTLQAARKDLERVEGLCQNEPDEDPGL